MFPEEVDKIEKYIDGLPDMILGSVKASKPKTMQEAIEFTTELMDENTHAYAKHQAEKKRNDNKPYAGSGKRIEEASDSFMHAPLGSGGYSSVGRAPLLQLGRCDYGLDV
ncbi:hypothetical protein Tco_1555023 [Tanacetum coccineum]